VNKPFDCCPIIVIDVFWLWRSLLSVSKWLVDLKSTSGREWQGKPNEHVSANGKPRKPTHFPKNRRWWTVAQSGSKTKMCVTQCIFSYQAFVLTQYGFRLVGGFLTTPTIFAPNLLVRRRSLNSEIICFFILFSITLTHTICSPYWNSIHFRSTKLMLHLQSRSFTSIHIFLINFFVCLLFIKRLECSTLKSTFYRRIK